MHKSQADEIEFQTLQTVEPLSSDLISINFSFLIWHQKITFYPVFEGYLFQAHELSNVWSALSLLGVTTIVGGGCF